MVYENILYRIHGTGIFTYMWLISMVNIQQVHIYKYIGEYTYMDPMIYNQTVSGLCKLVYKPFPKHQATCFRDPKKNGSRLWKQRIRLGKQESGWGNKESVFTNHFPPAMKNPYFWYTCRLNNPWKRSKISFKVTSKPSTHAESQQNKKK